MQILVDTTTKTVTLQGYCNVTELFEILNKMVPEGLKDWKMKSYGAIHIETSSYDVEKLQQPNRVWYSSDTNTCNEIPLEDLDKSDFKIDYDSK